MSSRYAVIDQNNRVTNVIAWDGVTEWQPPAGYVIKPKFITKMTLVFL